MDLGYFPGSERMRPDSASMGRVKCGFCYTEWPAEWRTLKGARKSGWVALADHLYDLELQRLLGIDTGHPALAVTQLCLVALGRETSGSLTREQEDTRRRKAKLALLREQRADRVRPV